MLFFDYEKIYVLAAGRSDLIIRYIKNIKYKPEQYKMLLGSSFIVNEGVVIWNSNHLTSQQLAEYIGILSIRSYHNYLVSGDTSLDIQLIYPWIPREVVENNPLIAIKQNKLIFNEEITHG